MSKTQRSRAEVVLSCGRYFLRVSGLYLAMETDRNRDPGFPGPAWTEDDLREAADIINDREKCPHGIRIGDYCPKAGCDGPPGKEKGR
jgi:hypothetical protein